MATKACTRSRVGIQVLRYDCFARPSVRPMPPLIWGMPRLDPRAEDPLVQRVEQPAVRDEQQGLLRMAIEPRGQHPHGPRAGLMPLLGVSGQMPEHALMRLQAEFCLHIADHEAFERAEMALLQFVVE